MGANTWQNSDGLKVRFGGDHSAEESKLGPCSVNTMGVIKQLVLDYDLQLLSDATEYSAGRGFTTDLNNDGVRDGFNPGDAKIPAGAYVTRALMYVTEAAAGGTSIVVGGFEEDGSVVDNDGFFTTILTAALTDGALFGGDADQGDVGADVGVQVSATLDVYPAVDVTGTFTAGKGRVIIEYIDEV